MTCLKCNKEVNPEWLCCPFHAEMVMLKKKCLECGEMERIGRLVCESKYKKANNEFINFMNNSRPKYVGYALIIALCSLALFLVLAFLIAIASLFLENHILKKMPVILFILGSFSSIIIAMIGLLLDAFLGPYSKKYREPLEQEFFRLHPDYAEILEKAKPADAKAMADEGDKK